MTCHQKFSIAIVGMAFRLPGDVVTSKALWRVLKNGENLVSTVSEARFPFKNYLHTRKTEPGKSHTFSAGLLSRVDAFDASFFGITPREAQQMDPQQRMLLETTWEALEHGGQNVDALAGSDCGVYIGIGGFDHMLRYVNDMPSIDLYTMLGNCASIASNRISYAFDFHGPSLSIDTACSSSLVALHQACGGLWRGESSMAIAGGVNVLLSPTGFVGFSKASMLSPEGQCKSFGADGRGYVRAEGCVVLFLKPLADALRDGDPIQALILNSGVNSDGQTHGIALPNGDAQAALITRVHAEAGIAADDVDYLEAHGTGTVVGDRTEAHALGAALGQKRAKDNPLLIGSIKSNCGHLEVASGLTGVLKTILCLQNRTIPRSLFADNLNPDIPFESLNLKVMDVEQPLKKQNKPAIMAVNSFGFGGTNAHVLLASHESKPFLNTLHYPLPPLLLSARDEQVFPSLAKQHLELLKDNPDAHYDLAYALAHRRALHQKGLLVYGENQSEVIEALASLSQGNMPSGAVTEERLGNDLPIALIYSGNGSQWPGMGLQLLQNEPTFIETIDEIDALYARHADFSIKAALNACVETHRFDETEVAQPCIFALQVAMTRYFLKQGMKIGAVLGHSVGEIAAAWACGALTLAQASEVIYHRSFWQGKTRGLGKMLAVALSEHDVKALMVSNHCGQTVEIAAVNSPKGVTLAGDLDQLLILQRACNAEGIFNRLLNLDYAFHTHHMEGIREGLLAALSHLVPQKNTLPFISTVTGGKLSGDALGGLYWWKNIRQPVRFNEAIQILLNEGISIGVEVGPHPVLKPYILESTRLREQSFLLIPTFRRHADAITDLRRATFRTWLSGGQWDKTLYFPVVGHAVTLPPYPFLKTSHWMTPSLENMNQLDRRSEHPLLGWRVHDSIWENHLDQTTPNYLACHKVDGVVVMPAAGYAEMAIAASKLGYGDQQHVIKDLDIVAPMILEENTSRLLRFELQLGSGDFVIKSRIRLTEEPWMVHGVGRVMSLPLLPSVQQCALKTNYPHHMDAATLYQGARVMGLDYGPLFQNIESMDFDVDEAFGRLSVNANVLTHLEHHDLYPGHLDACFQLLIGLFAQRGALQDTLLPIRMGQLQLFTSMPKTQFVMAKIRLQSKQSVLADFKMLDIDGHVVAQITDCRFKKVSFSEQVASPSLYTCKPYLLSSFAEKTSPDLKRLTHTHQDERPFNPFETVVPLMDMMVSRLIYSTMKALVPSRATFSLADVGVSSDKRLFLKWCFTLLLEEDLLQTSDNILYTLVQLEDEIDPKAMWTLLLNHYPKYSTELLWLGRVGLHLKDILQGVFSVDELFHARSSKDAFFHFLEDSPSATGLHSAVCQTMTTLIEQWDPSQNIKILDIGHGVGQLSRCLVRLMPKDRTDYHVVVQDDCVTSDEWGVLQVKDLQSIAHEQFDVILIRHQLHAFDVPAETLLQLKTMLKAQGVLLLMERHACRMHDLILGLQADWFQEERDGSMSSSLRSDKVWQQGLIDAGFEMAEPTFEPGASPGEGAFFIWAKPTQHTDVEAVEKPSLDVLVFAQSKQPLHAFLQERHQVYLRCDIPVLTLDTEDAHSEYLHQHLKPFTKQPKRLHILWTSSQNETPTQGCSALLNLVKAIENMVWVKVPMLVVVTHEADPCSGALCGFARVLQNEHPALNCKIVQGETLASHIEQEMLCVDGEQEVMLTPFARYGLRIESVGLNHSPIGDKAYRLDFKRAGSLNHLKWFPRLEKALGPDEVLVRPEAAGLNFRDIMYAMGLIPDEAVESGFLGATLGMEFAGVVLAVGQKVTSFSIGARVMGFAPASFSSETITKAHAITACPPGLSSAEAATVPIAFFTAYYALHHLARLQAGERILIHGAAGGVGLAAIQVARDIGAEVYVTAGTPEKREFLQLLGISNRYDSRTLSFAEEILADTGREGVDVVLNCLAGEAITLNLTLLKPFGRFLELGKRDFFANSKMGLRPFRQNISYFGIDADQLLIKKPALCAKLFKKIMALFAKERFFPLPYREFEAENIIEPFRYMQQSRHIGKVIINLEKRIQGHFQTEEPTLVLSRDAAYLVTGGLSGFGLKTALWLSEKGARHLVLVSRRGACSDEAKQALSVLEASGCDVSIHALDVADATAVSSLVASIPTLKGVIHAAVVYDDALIQNLNFERMGRVLLPKLQGAWNLHHATMACSLDFFVVYSSVTTLFGNPGQANYVAANTGLEQLIAHRRAHHLPGHFAAFGPIADAGYLARHGAIKNKLSLKLGIQTLTSEVALRQLERLVLSKEPGFAIGHLNVLRKSLPTFKSPKFSKLLLNEQQFGDGGGDEDIRLLLEGQPPEEALTLICDRLTRDIAKILRLPVEKIDSKASLLEMGMDSLIGAELGFAIEQRFSIQIPMLALSQGLSVHQMAKRILSQLQHEDEPEVSQLLDEAHRHGEVLSVDFAKSLLKTMQEPVRDHESS